ncbi:MAG: hypothetical protein IJX28_06470 [Clostridia bacterium]|nr:hypothetical protein [Clostridia bacterium]
MEEYFLKSKNDKSDRSAEIEEKLKFYGVCILGSGVFYVTGVKMPDHSTLWGQGNATRVILSPEVSDGAAIQIGSFCTVRNLCLAGAEEEFSERPAEIGTRTGLLFMGTARHSGDRGPQNAIVESCYIHSFTGGGLKCLDTGYHVRSSMTASNCHITRCGVGIYIPHFSEFHQFTNMHCTHNRYGCINNGGNNMFVNCDFSGNTLGFLIDNSDGMAKNNSHGSAIGCTFHHSDDNKGIGIKIVNARSGYVFSGCQIGFSNIVLDNSARIQFTGMNILRFVKIEIHGGSTMMTSCFFGAPESVNAIKLSGGAKFRWNDCIDSNGNDCITVEEQK